MVSKARSTTVEEGLYYIESPPDPVVDFQLSSGFCLFKYTSRGVHMSVHGNHDNGCGVVHLHVSDIELSSQTDRIVEPVPKVLIRRMVEYHKSQNDTGLQRQNRVVFGGKVVK